MTRKAIVATLSSISLFSVASCGVGEANIADLETEGSVAPLPVEVVLPERGDIFALYDTTSTLESDNDAPVLARVAGEVVSILVEEGTYVKKGRILARLDGQQLRLQMQQAKADFEKVRAEYQRLVTLQERGLVSAAMYEGLKFDMAALQAGYQLKRLNYDYTNIRAPIAGIVSSRDIKIGQQMRINDPAFRISDTSKLVAHLKIPQTELLKFAAGQTVSLNVDAMPETSISAIIDRISPTIDASNGTFRATAYVDNTRSLLAPGMFARFSIAYEKHANALVIPAAAVIEEDSLAVVYVVSDGAVERRVIETGIQSGGLIEVLGGLDIRELIVITGQSGLRDGSPVLASNHTNGQVSG